MNNIKNSISSIINNISKIFTKNLIEKISLLFIVSIILFHIIPIPPLLYLLVEVSIVTLLIYLYKPLKNYEFYFQITPLFITNNIAYIMISPYVYKYSPLMIIFAVLIIFYIYITIIFSQNIKNENYNNNIIDIFPEHKHDLVRIKHYLSTFEIIGINATWGNGKTYLINALEKENDIQDKYFFITINLLSCNLNELQLFLINELERALNNFGIASIYSFKLKNILNKNEMLKNISEIILFNTDLYSKLLCSFKNELKKSGKTFVIVYEDIDRINSSDIIKEIFSISENIACHHIKIIYEYDKNNLMSIDKVFDSNYLEKYIPYTLNLTSLRFTTTISYILKKQNIDRVLIDLDDFTFLTYPVPSNFGLEKILGKSFKENSIQLNLNGISIRKIEHFIYELAHSLKTNPNYLDKKQKKYVITFFILKHFYIELYEDLDIFQTLEECLKLQINEETLTISEIQTKINNQQLHSDNIFTVNSNKVRLAFLCLFDYNFDIEHFQYDPNNPSARLNKSINDIKKEDANEKKDRLIWNLLCSGKSEYTDIQLMVDSLKQIFSLEVTEQEVALKKLVEDYYHGKDNYKNDNRTIFRFGIPPFTSIFQALSLYNADNNTWINFLNYYFDKNLPQKITIDLVSNLRYCPINNKELYLHILSKFCKLNIIGNMNNNEFYWRFLHKYLHQCIALEYVLEELSTTFFFRDKNFNFHSNNTKEFISKMILNLKEELLKTSTFVPLDKIKIEINLIINFIDKNLELINQENVIQDEPVFKVNISSQRSSHTETNRLKALYTYNPDQEYILDEIEKSYIAGKITPYEISQLPFIKTEDILY